MDNEKVNRRVQENKKKRKRLQRRWWDDVLINLKENNSKLSKVKFNTEKLESVTKLYV